MKLAENEVKVTRNYAGGIEKLTPDDEPDIVFKDAQGNTLALCEVKTPCMINRDVFTGQLEKFAKHCERKKVPFYLCVPAKSLGAALVLISETGVFEGIIKQNLFSERAGNPCLLRQG